MSSLPTHLSAAKRNAASKATSPKTSKPARQLCCFFNLSCESSEQHQSLDELPSSFPMGPYQVVAFVQGSSKSYSRGSICIQL